MDVVNGKKITRPYSVASVPNGTNHFALCLNSGCPKESFHRIFLTCSGATSWKCGAPMGMFVVRDPARECVFVATGTGIAPFRSLLHAHVKPGSPNFTLLFGVRYHHTLMYAGVGGDGAQASALRSCRCSADPIRSGPAAPGTSRRICRSHRRPAAMSMFFLCGMKAMVDDVRSILKEMASQKADLFEKYD